MSSTIVVETNTEVKHRPSISEKPITEERAPLVPTTDSDNKNGPPSNYAVPRANVAATIDAPNGTTKDKYGYRNRKKTVCATALSILEAGTD